eukprot:scaffold2360_cov380-Prasinococcus_capsulatus_cf.AAC.23
MDARSAGTFGARVLRGGAARRCAVGWRPRMVAAASPRLFCGTAMRVASHQGAYKREPVAGTSRQRKARGHGRGGRAPKTCPKRRPRLLHGGSSATSTSGWRSVALAAASCHGRAASAGSSNRGGAVDAGGVATQAHGLTKSRPHHCGYYYLREHSRREVVQKHHHAKKHAEYAKKQRERATCEASACRSKCDAAGRVDCPTGHGRAVHSLTDTLMLCGAALRGRQAKFAEVFKKESSSSNMYYLKRKLLEASGEAAELPNLPKPKYRKVPTARSSLCAGA